MFKRIFNAIKKLHFKDFISPLIFLIMLIPSWIFRMIKKIQHKELWLVSEEGEARDNGYQFFRYIREEHPADFCFYAIKETAANYNEVSKLGNIIKYGSLKHWLYYMSAKLNISSQTTGNPNMFLWYIIHVPLGMYRNRVFLQHGVTLNDALPLYYKKTKFKYFVTTAKPEYEEISKKFGYPEGSVILTGFPRWDILKDDSSSYDKTILIMPTWRKYLEIQNNKMFNRDNFIDSEYYRAWNSLLNNKEFVDFIEKNDIKVYFYPHQNVQSKLSLFKSYSHNVKIVGMNDNISKYLSRCSLMITDYSSVMFDFAYLGKPVICYQFDKTEFRSKHHGEGYFSYERDGFGPVVEKESELVYEIKKYATEPELPKYILKNMKKFFGENGMRNNSEHLYNILINEKRRA